MATGNPWPTTWPTLMRRVRDADDHEAWTTLVALYEPLLYRYGRRRGLQDADARDLTQLVLAKIARFEYHQERGRFRGWLATVTRRELRRLQKAGNRPGRGAGEADREAVVERLPADGEDPDWDRLFNARVLEVALSRIRPEFDDHQWRALLDVAFDVVDTEEGPGYAWRDRPPDGRVREAAERAGRPVAWVYKVKWRALQRLREEVLELAGDLPLPG